MYKSLYTAAAIRFNFSMSEGFKLFKSRDSTSERFEPSSRTFLIGEQPNPWDLLQPQDKVSRHRNVSTITSGMDYIFTPHQFSEIKKCFTSYLCSSMNIQKLEIHKLHSPNW